MNINEMDEMKSRTDYGKSLLNKIEKYDDWIKKIERGQAESCWIGGNLVNFKGNCATNGIQGVCTEDEAKELSDIIKKYLIDKLEKKKKEYEEKFENC